MAGSFTDYMENKVISHALSGAAWTPVTTYYVGLFISSPGETGGGTEATGGAYARQPITFTTTGSVASNAAQIEFPVSSSDHGAVVDIGLFDAITGGNLVAYNDLSPTKTYNTGETIRITAGSFTVTQS